MEEQQLLLVLCASHWKADHVLGSSLMVKAPSNTADTVNTNKDSMVEHFLQMTNKHCLDVTNSPACRQKKLRRHTDKQRAPIKKGMSEFFLHVLHPLINTTRIIKPSAKYCPCHINVSVTPCPVCSADGYKDSFY